MSRFIRRLFSRRRHGNGKQYTFVKKDNRVNPLFLNYLQSSGFMRPIRRYSPPARWGRRAIAVLAGLFLLFIVYVLVVSLRALTLF